MESIWKQRLLRIGLVMLAVGLLFTAGCDELLNDDDDSDGYTSPPADMLGDWYLFAGGLLEEETLMDVTSLSIRIEIYSTSDSGTKFRFYAGGSQSSGSVDWRVRSGSEYLGLIEDGAGETEIEVLARGGEVGQFIFPDNEEGDQLWVMAKGNQLLAGLLTDENNYPVAAATVTITNGSGDEVASTMTADLGVYLVTDLSVGALRVEATKSGYNASSDWFTVEYSRPVFRSFRMTESGGGTEDGIVYGQVTDAVTGDPIPGTVVGTTDGEHEDTANEYGDYVLFLPPGQFLLVATAEGYISEMLTVNVAADGYHQHNIELTPGGGGSGTVAGLVTSSQTGSALAGVTVSVVGTSTSTTTDAAGHYSLTAAEGVQQIRAELPEYYTLTQQVVVQTDETTDLNFSLSPVIASGSGSMRLVLTWGATPYDLDSHLLTPEIHGIGYHVYFATRGDSLYAPYARLDVDDTSGFGPETITIYQVMEGTYRYYIYNWSGTPSIAGCGAQVQIYNEDGLLQSVTVPNEGNGDYWYVCDIEGTSGTVTIVNEVSTGSPSFTPGNSEHKVH